MSWRLIACRPRGDGTEELITNDIPIGSGNTVTVALSGPTSMSIKLPMHFAHMMGGDGNPVFMPWGTTVYAERKGVIVAGGIVDDLTEEGGVLELSVIGFSGYLSETPFTSEYVGYNVDPLNVARLIWNHVQTQAGGNLGLAVSGLRTNRRMGTQGIPAFRGRPAIYDDKGALVTAAIPPHAEVADEPYVLAWYQTADLLEEFNKLSKATPFDYVERHGWVGNHIGHYLDFGHPTLGRKRTNLRFVPGENVLAAPKVYQQGDLYASEILLLGAGEGRAKIKGISNQTTRTRLRRVAVVNEPGIGTADSAKALADSELKYRTGDPNVADFSLVDHPNAPVGSFDVGDIIFAQSGSDWFGESDTWVRIASITYEMGEREIISIVAVKEGAE